LTAEAPAFEPSPAEYVPVEREETVRDALGARAVQGLALAVGASSFGLAIASFRLADAGGLATFWLPSGLLLAVALRARRIEWPAHLVAGAAGVAAAAAASGHGTHAVVASTLVTLAAAATGAALVRWIRGEGESEPAGAAVLIGAGGVLAAALAAAAGALWLDRFASVPFGSSFGAGMAGVASGTVALCPAILAWTARRSPGEPSLRLPVAATAIAAAAALAVAVYAPSAPGDALPRDLAFVVAPLLFVGYLAVFAGTAATATAAAAVWIVAAWFTAREYGPLVLAGHDGVQRVLTVHYLDGTALAALVLLAVVVSSRERARAERLAIAESFDALATSAPVGILLTDARGRCVYTNPRWSRITHISAEAAIGEGWRDMLHPDDRARVLRLFDEAFAAGGDMAERFRILGPLGSVRWVSARLAVRRTRGGEVAGFVGTLGDITADVEAEDAKASFLARTSHELRTPLTVIRGLAQTLARADLTADKREEMLGVVIDRASHLNALIDRLLLAGGSESADLPEFTPAALHLGPLIRTQAAAVEASPRHDVVIEIPKSLPRAWANARGVSTILDELVDNAIKFSPAGGTVTLDVRADDGRIVVGVADWGIGMDDEQQQRCFDKFWQAEDRDSRSFEGTGIGLFVVQETVRAMGGDVWVKSILGSGTRFEFALPVAPAGGSRRRAAAS